MTYIVTKYGVYLKGVYFLTESKEEAISRCVEYAQHDEDDYHGWCVEEYEPIDVRDASDIGAGRHRALFRTSRAKYMKADSFYLD